MSEFSVNDRIESWSTLRNSATKHYLKQVQLFFYFSYIREILKSFGNFA